MKQHILGPLNYKRLSIWHDWQICDREGFAVTLDEWYSSSSIGSSSVNETVKYIFHADVMQTK